MASLSPVLNPKIMHTSKIAVNWNRHCRCSYATFYQMGDCAGGNTRIQSVAVGLYMIVVTYLLKVLASDLDSRG